MILPSFADDCNERSLPIAQKFFDDHYARTAHHLQQRLKQRTPQMVDGGRAILWFCRFCQKPWYELGRLASFVCLSASQLARLARTLGVDVRSFSSYPSSICPLCAALHLGGMLRIEEYPEGKGYRLLWEGVKSPRARFCCLVYRSNTKTIEASLGEALCAPSDILTFPLRHVKSMLGWLKTLPDPGEDAVVPLTLEHCNQLSRCVSPRPGFSWCGYSWQTQCPSLGEVLVALGITFSSSSICSRPLLIECWRQIARELEGVLSC